MWVLTVDVSYLVLPAENLFYDVDNLSSLWHSVGWCAVEHLFIWIGMSGHCLQLINILVVYTHFEARDKRTNSMM